MKQRRADQRGFSLVELMTVVAIAGSLMAIGALYFSDMQKKTTIERDVTTIYSNLSQIRMQALYNKTPRSVRFVGNSFKIYSSQVNHTQTAVAPVMTIYLTYGAVLTGGINQIDFDASGVATGVNSSDAPTGETAVCIDPYANLAKSNPGFTDSVDVMPMKTLMGKRQSGGACAPASIDQK